MKLHGLWANICRTGFKILRRMQSLAALNMQVINDSFTAKINTKIGTTEDTVTLF